MKLFGICGAVLLCFSANAAEPAVAVKESILDQFYVNIFSKFRGPSTKDLGSANAGSGTRWLHGERWIGFDNDLTVGYMFNDNLGYGLLLPLIYIPVAGQGFAIGDVGIKVLNHHLISSGGFNLYADLMVQLPSSQASRAVHSYSIRTTPHFRYQFSESRFAVGSRIEFKRYLNVSNETKLYGAPYLDFQLTSSLLLNLKYEYEAYHYAFDPGTFFKAYETDFQPGLVWFITPGIMLNPYLQIFTNIYSTRDRTAVGAILSATLF